MGGGAEPTRKLASVVLWNGSLLRELFLVVRSKLTLCHLQTRAATSTYLVCIWQG